MGRVTEEEAATQFCVELSRVRGYLEFEYQVGEIRRAKVRRHPRAVDVGDL